MSDVVFDKSAVPDFMDLLRLHDRAFVVLGGGNGMGRQVCHALTQAGGRVACVDRTPELAEFVAGEIGGIPLVGDITKRADVKRIFAEAADKLGPISGLVDIVGMPVLGPFDQLDDEQWDRQFDLVLRHAFLAMQIGGQAIMDAGGGTMVFIGSNSGIGYSRGQAAYGSAKAALHHLVATVGREYAPRGVRINAIAPGLTLTPRIVESPMGGEDLGRISAMIPRGQAALPSEIAGPVLFLSSGLASNIYGRTILADGGWEGIIAFPNA